jgi:effector-binding domain-containing protein
MQLINSYLQQIEEKVNKANQLYQDTNPATFSQNQALAKAEYLKQAKNLMTIAEKT